MSHQQTPKRRNGKQQACEPCRKRKMACDHTLPVCHRCRKRKSISACIYLPAPMTRKTQAVSDGGGQQLTLAPSNIQILDAPPTIIAVYNEHGSPTSPLSVPGSSISDASKAKSTALYSNSAGFLGSTSFSAVFSENRSTLEPSTSVVVSRHEQSVVSELTSTEEPYECSTVGNLELEAHLIRLGTKVLGMIPDQDTCRILVDRCNKTNNGWPRSALTYALDAMWATFGAYLVDPQKHEIMAKIIAKTTRIPLEEPEDPKGWLDSFSGEKLRWDALGILFASWAYGALTLAENDDLLKATNGRCKGGQNELFLQLKDCCSSCISLSRHTNCVNPLMVFLSFNNNLLESVCVGDTGLSVWRLGGDVASLTTALGLHRESDSGTSSVSIRSEMRRRIYAIVFTIDKVLATFMGRPPALSGRYNSCPAPLDISDEVLMGGEPGLSNAVALLDSNGWNTDGQIYQATVLRERFYEGQIRDEVLEISLGGRTHRIAERLQEVRERSAALQLSYPRTLVWKWEDLSNPLVTDFQIWTRLAARLEHLQNEFLIERLSIKHNLASAQALVDISSEMLSLTLVLWTHRDRFEGRHHDYEWMSMYWGCPASGILCIELLKQSSPPSSQQNSSYSPIKLSRSTTIQNLSLFVSFLSWVKPSTPNSSLCMRIKDIIARVLDKLLEAPPPSQASVPQSLGGYYDFDFVSGVNFGDADDFGVNYDLWDTFEWLREVQG